jgi:1-acyl-sn-glycerol-3-phosphate acyltransferase
VNRINLTIIRTIFSVFYTLWVLTIFTVFMIVLLPFIIIPFLLGENFGWLGYKALWTWSWIFDKLTGIRYKIIGQENIKRRQSYIYVCNHTSFLDIPGLCLIIPGEFRPLAKKELGKIPMLGWIVKSACVIVDRGDNSSRKKSLSKLVDVITRGISPLIFAEGTQNRTTELLQPFKEGAFRIATDTQTNILPLVVIGANKLMYPGNAKIASPGIIKVVAGEVIDVKSFNGDTAALRQHTFTAMLNLIHKNS